jgi:hypothetical protein
MNKAQFQNLRIGDRVLHVIDGAVGKVFEVRPCNDGVRILWNDGQRTYCDVTDPNYTHSQIVPTK